MSITFAGLLVNRGTKYLLNVSPHPLNLWQCQSYRLRRLTTSAVVSHEERGKDDLGHTTILSQNGTVIQELPVIVRKAKLTPALWNEEVNNNRNNQKYYSGHSSDDEEEPNGIVVGIKRCRTLSNLFDLTQAVAENELTPTVALEALRKLIELENNQHYRRRSPQNGGLEVKERNFLRDSIVSHLLEGIIESQDPNLILEALKTITRDVTRAASRNNNSWISHYRIRLSHEALIFATDSKFSLTQLCEVVHAFAYIEKGESKFIDMLWVGFESRANEINEDNIVDVFRVLPLLKKSRRVVFSVVENAFMQLCWHLPGAVIAEIMTVLQLCREDGQMPPQSVLGEISYWIATHITSVTEEELVDIVTALTALEYTSPQIVQSLEKYISTHNKNSELLARVMEFASRFRLRSTTIMETCAIHLIKHSHIMSPVDLKSIFIQFGLLHYHPADSQLFLEAVESSFFENFVRFRPEDATDILLAFIYLQHYPINFVSKVFNSHFLDRVVSCQNLETIRAVHTKLKLFDLAMTLDCADYRGPLLPRESDLRSVWIDGRLRRILDHIVKPLEKIVGASSRISQFVLLSDMPAVSLYVIDILLHPHPPPSYQSGRLTLSQAERNMSVAFLVHVPDHYCAQMQHLIGPQVLRHHHLQKSGIRTVKLRYDVLARLRMNPKSLERYLKESLRCAREGQVMK